MACFSLALMPQNNKKASKNQRIAVAVRVFHNKRVGYISTGVNVGCTAAKDGTVQPHWHDGMITTLEPEWLAKNQVAEDCLQTMVTRFAHIVNPGEMTCQEVCRALRNGMAREARTTLRQAANDYLETRRGTVSRGYCQMVEHSVERLCDWTPGELYLADIDAAMLSAYHKHLRGLTQMVVRKTAYYSTQYKQTRYKREQVQEKTLSEASVTKELAHIKAIVNYAIGAELVSYTVHPFHSVVLHRSCARETDISPEAMKVLRDANLDNSNYQLARDVFMLSFYLGGMNYKDIINADFSSDMVIYCREKTKLRTKTQRVVKVPILPEAREILDRRTRRGKWCSGLNFTNTRDEISYIGKNLKKVVEMLSLPKYLTFYSARKSFAQYSLDLGINDAVTDYLMGHSDNRRGVISYYSRVTPRMAGVALRKIINYLENPEAYIEDIERAIMD